MIRAPITNNPYKYKYNGKELQDELGLGLYDMHFRQYDPAIGRFLSMDPVNRPMLSPYSAFDNNPVYWSDPTGAMSDSFLKDLWNKSGSNTTWTNNNNGTFSSEDGTTVSTGEPTPLEASLMAKHVYGENVKLIGGWQASSVSGFNLNDKDSGLLGKLYERTINGKKEYALVYAGTQEIRQDGVQDLLQAFGLSGQYKIAVQNAEDTKKILGGADITFIGHSLGGGLAQASAMAIGGNAITFNPAWVSVKTKEALGLFNSATITNYVVLGEVLDNMQTVLGSKQGLFPSGQTKYLFSWGSATIVGSFMNHMIDSVIKEILDVKEYTK